MTSHRFGSNFRHHRGQQQQQPFIWTWDMTDYGPSYGPIDQTPPEAAPPIGGGPYAGPNDIPWDWAHRYPPTVSPSTRPYVSSCAAETVTVPDGHGGNGQVNITRCY